jgi:hypothetical protein
MISRDTEGVLRKWPVLGCLPTVLQQSTMYAGPYDVKDNDKLVSSATPSDYLSDTDGFRRP